MNDYSRHTVITLQPGRSRRDTVVECANCSLHGDVGAVLSETVATVSLSTGINRCGVQRPFYAPTQRRPSSGYRGPVNCNSLMLCGLPQFSSVHCGLTTGGGGACCCCPTQVTNEYCCRQTFQNGPTQRCVNRIQTTARVQQMGIPAGTAVTIQDVNHGCRWGGVTFALLCGRIAT